MDAMRFAFLPMWNHAWMMYQTILAQAQSRRLTAGVNVKTPSNWTDSLLSYDERTKTLLLDHKQITKPTEDVSPSSSTIYTRDRSEMKRVFDLFDENRDGLICARDLQLFMKRLGFELSDEEVKGMVKTVDLNSDDTLDFEEFFSLYNSLCGERLTEDTSTASVVREDDDEEGALREAFLVFDTNKDGLISAPELQQVLLNLGLPEGKSLMSCRRMIERVDADGNGEVDFSEFKIMMSSAAFKP